MRTKTTREILTARYARQAEVERLRDALERVEGLLLEGGEHRVHDALAVIAEVRE